MKTENITIVEGTDDMYMYHAASNEFDQQHKADLHYDVGTSVA